MKSFKEFLSEESQKKQEEKPHPMTDRVIDVINKVRYSTGQNLMTAKEIAAHVHDSSIPLKDNPTASDVRKIARLHGLSKHVAKENTGDIRRTPEVDQKIDKLRRLGHNSSQIEKIMLGQARDAGKSPTKVPSRETISRALNNRIKMVRDHIENGGDLRQFYSDTVASSIPRERIATISAVKKK